MSGGSNIRSLFWFEGNYDISCVYIVITPSPDVTVQMFRPLSFIVI